MAVLNVDVHTSIHLEEYKVEGKPTFYPRDVQLISRVHLVTYSVMHS